YWQRAHEPQRAGRDAAVKAGLEADGALAVACPGALLVDPDAVRTRAGTPYRVFSAYWKAWREHLNVPAPSPAPTRIPGPRRWPQGLAPQALGLDPGLGWTDGLAGAWEVGEEAARVRLAAFCAQRLERYAIDRDHPGVDGVSRLSPYLHFGELSPRQIWYTVRAAEEDGGAAGRSGAESYLRQLGWREFAAYVLHHWPETASRSMDRRFEQFPWRTDYGDLLRRWQQGRTGYPLVDAGMRELWRTGWMHNRARMLTASFLVKNCRIPWQEGARWFWDTLVDADLGSNSLGWQWTAGTGVDAAPYFRVFSPVRQGERFDAGGAYVRRWLPALSGVPDRWVHQPWAGGSASRRGEAWGTPGYPEPVVDFDLSRREALAADRQLRRGRR
ncbi:MAG: deoxyribodipyrimidine photo-lyase, partial [Gammaproteobacteria bacterium]